MDIVRFVFENCQGKTVMDVPCAVNSISGLLAHTQLELIILISDSFLLLHDGDVVIKEGGGRRKTSENRDDGLRASPAPDRSHVPNPANQIGRNRSKSAAGPKRENPGSARCVQTQQNR